MHSIYVLSAERFKSTLASQGQQGLANQYNLASDYIQALVDNTDYDKPFILMVNNNYQVVLFINSLDSHWSFAHLAKLPKGDYKVIIQDSLSLDISLCKLAFALGFYSFSSVKSQPQLTQTLPSSVTLTFDAHSGTYTEQELKAVIDSIYYGRDLINLPYNKLTTHALYDYSKALSDSFKAEWTPISLESIQSDFPLVYAVGKGSSNRPYMVDFSWGNPKHKALTLVGKGVCYDTGGYSIKPTDSMLLMHKDMGGAAHTLALARLIMALNLPVRLRVCIAIVDNAIDGNSFRPGDIIQSRSGKTVFIGNTDAEGRLILADSLAYVSESKPDLIIDFATLTGAARVALGPDLPPYFSDNDSVNEQLWRLGKQVDDPVWCLPLWGRYEPKVLGSRAGVMADLTNTPYPGQAGAITAALFLKQFVYSSSNWVHIDTHSYNLETRPARQKGGDMQSMRAVYAYLKTVFVA